MTEELLILTKTYPSPSATYRETTCVAAINNAGKLRRLFPVPYRLLEGDAQFKKWEWMGREFPVPPKIIGLRVIGSTPIPSLGPEKLSRRSAVIGASVSSGSNRM
jgi:hypothetical protein